MKRVCVLMSTYNGEKYLKEQINSILSQEGVEVVLLIRDDGSSDNTIEILNEYASLDNVTLLNDSENVGPCKSFLRLVERSDSYDYYAFSDQDDIWDKDKLFVACTKLSAYSNVPCLYYSNLRVVNEQNVFCRLSHKKPHVAKSRFSCLSESLPTGCTMVYNNKLSFLLKQAHQPNVTMHDSWIYLVASLFGEVIYDFEPHINYRQHGGNVIGVTKKVFSFSSVKREIREIFNRKSQPRYTNAVSFYKFYRGIIEDEQIINEIEKIVFYKKSLINTFKLLFDRKINSNSFRRKMRFKIKVLLHNV